MQVLSELETYDVLELKLSHLSRLSQPHFEIKPFKTETIQCDILKALCYCTQNAGDRVNTEKTNPLP